MKTKILVLLLLSDVAIAQAQDRYSTLYKHSHCIPPSMNCAEGIEHQEPYVEPPQLEIDRRPDSMRNQPYVPPPKPDMRPQLNPDDVIDAALKGSWDSLPGSDPLKFKINRQRKGNFELRMLKHPYCSGLVIRPSGLQYQLPDDGAKPSSPESRWIPRLQINFDGDRKKRNCLSMPAYVYFKFTTPFTYDTAQVAVIEQFVSGPEWSEFKMTHRR